MNEYELPHVMNERRAIKTIYLDTCIMIELSKYERGICKNTYKEEIGELYNLLTEKKRDKQIWCPLGSQMQEMGMMQNRENARDFLFRFTNSELLHPDLIYNRQMKIGYQAFVQGSKTIMIDLNTAFKFDKYENSPFRIHVTSIYKQEKANEFHNEKIKIVDVLNEMKERKEVRDSFEKQLIAELKTEYILFVNNIINNKKCSEEEYIRYFEEMEKFYQNTGIVTNESQEQLIRGLANYKTFLMSPYHDLLPYVWIRANLWSHLMQRQNKIKQGDNMDIQWAAAYLPFVDYAVTDNAFCKLLNDSGLSNEYSSKIFSFDSLRNLLNELNN